MRTQSKIAVAALIAGLLTLPATVAWGADESVENLPGYVDLGGIEIPSGAKEVQEIDLGPALLQLAAGEEQGEESPLAQALAQVKSIRVKAFSIDEGEAERLRPRIEKMQADLESRGWESVIRMRDDQEMVNVSVKRDGERMAGIMVIALDPGDEAAFVNVVGDLDLALLAQAAFGLGGEGLDQMLEGLKQTQEKAQQEGD